MSKKTTGMTLAGILFAAIALIHWNCCNIYTPIANIEASMQNWVDIATTRSQGPNDLTEIKTWLDTSRQAKAYPSVRKAFNQFDSAWKKDAMLKSDTPYSARIKSSFEPIKHRYNNTKYNQLGAVVLIWVVNMLALWLCIFTPILRDTVGNPNRIDGQIRFNELVSQNTPAAVKPPYSLSRTQLVLWITIISSVYIYAVLWDERSIPGINETALILMGISAGTFAMGAFMDTAEIEQGVSRNQDEPASGSFFKDILSDNKGYSIHRFQNLVWTSVAIIVYLYKYSNPGKGLENTLPVLDGTLLTLTGISSATYLTLKARENPAAPDIIKEFKLILQLDPAAVAARLTPVQIADINTHGFPDAVINITDQSGNTIHPVPVINKPDEFVAANIKSGNYTITATYNYPAAGAGAAAVPAAGAGAGAVPGAGAGAVPGAGVAAGAVPGAATAAAAAAAILLTGTKTGTIDTTTPLPLRIQLA